MEEEEEEKRKRMRRRRENEDDNNRSRGGHTSRGHDSAQGKSKEEIETKKSEMFSNLPAHVNWTPAQ
eukprot:9493725-Pyramimonas_sp.AAC.1